MTKQKAAARCREESTQPDLTDREIEQVFQDMHLSEHQRGLTTEDPVQATPMLLFPITVTTSVEQAIDW